MIQEVKIKSGSECKPLIIKLFKNQDKNWHCKYILLIKFNTLPRCWFGSVGNNRKSIGFFLTEYTGEKLA